MRYPVMTEKEVAARWSVSLKTLQRWRLNNEGPTWHKLFHHVRYHELDVLDFERRSAQHLMSLLGIERAVTMPAAGAINAGEQGSADEPEMLYISSKEVVEATRLPAYLFNDRAERCRKHVPHLMLVGNLRFSLEAILHWELASSVVGNAPKPASLTAAAEIDCPPEAPARVPRWHELVREQDRSRSMPCHKE